MKKTMSLIISGMILTFGTTVFALTLDEARNNIDKQATEKKLSAKDHSQATATLQGLVAKGVPVEHASRVVEASINQGVKGKDLAEVARSIESARPDARKEAASVAADAIQHKYNARDTVQMTSTFGKTVAGGAPADKASQVMTSGINKGVRAGSITSAMNSYAGEIKSGTAPDKAADDAVQTMGRDRTMQHDRDMAHDRMGSGSGMNHGMDRGAGMGSGAGPGTGGMRR